MKEEMLAADVYRGWLWEMRGDLVLHLMERGCPLVAEAMEFCEKAGWTYESYVLAAFFDSAELLVEVTK